MVYTAHIDPARGIVEITDSNGVKSTHKPNRGGAEFAPIVQARVLLKLAGYMPVNGSMRVDWGPGDCGLIRDAERYLCHCVPLGTYVIGCKQITCYADVFGEETLRGQRFCERHR